MVAVRNHVCIYIYISINDKKQNGRLTHIDRKSITLSRKIDIPLDTTQNILTEGIERGKGRKGTVNEISQGTEWNKREKEENSQRARRTIKEIG